MKVYRMCLLLVLCCLCSAGISQDSDYKIQSVFIVRFAKYIEWPQSAKSGDFQIGVFGSGEAEKAIESTVQGKTIGNQKITVRHFNSVSEITPCNILFVTFAKTSNYYAANARLQGKSALIITEKEGMAQKGSDINLVYTDGKMNFEINKAATEKAGLKIPANLLSLAKIY